MSFRSQLVLGFGGLLLLALLSGALSLAALHVNDQSQRAVVHDFAAELVAVERLRFLAEKVVATMRGRLLRKDPASAARFESARVELFSRIQQLRAQVDGDRSGLLNDVDRTAHAYVAAAASAMQEGGAPADISAFEDSVAPARAALDAALDGLVRSERSRVERQVELAGNVSREATGVVALSTLLAALVGLALSILWMRTLAQQFERERAAVEVARRATEARNDVLAVVSHDLRNPLTAILASVELLARPNASPERQQRRLETIRSAAQRMKHLIEGLLDSVRLEAQPPELHREPLPVSGVMDELAKLFEVRAAAEGVRLDVQPAAGTVEADHERLLQVLANLVGNALKFTPAGGQVRVVAEATDEGVRFDVRDSGAGIAPADLPHVFERNWQARQARREGLGLGLYIARTLVALHGGRIWAESAPGAGSCFHFVIPPAQLKLAPAASPR
jgi:signal transduction histidine kinase